MPKLLEAKLRFSVQIIHVSIHCGLPNQIFRASLYKAKYEREYFIVE